MPSQKEIVMALMSFEGRGKKSVGENGELFDREFLRYRCPKPSCSEGTIDFKEKSGYQNPYVHLRSCFGRGKPLAVQKALLDDMFEQVQAAAIASGGQISDHFQNTALSEYDETMNRYIRLIVLKRYPISSVVDKEFCAVSRYSCPIDAKTIRGVILALVQLVVDRIKKALTSEKGALLLDG